MAFGKITFAEKILRNIITHVCVESYSLQSLYINSLSPRISELEDTRAPVPKLAATPLGSFVTTQGPRSHPDQHIRICAGGKPCG